MVSTDAIAAAGKLYDQNLSLIVHIEKNNL